MHFLEMQRIPNVSNILGADSEIDPYNPINHGLAKGVVRDFWRRYREMPREMHGIRPCELGYVYLPVWV